MEGKPEFSLARSPLKHPGPGRLSTPPRTFPSQLVDDATLFSFDSRGVPFSPSSPGKRSPGRPKTMKEYEEDLVSLKKENFNLKIRIYFMEQSRLDSNLPKDVDELQNLYTDLKVEFEMQKKDLGRKEDLLLNSYRALDVQKQQLEAMKTEHEAEKLELQNKIESLEKELKEYHLKFMETSVQLDDTNAMYAITFGLNNKPEATQSADCVSEEKVKELEDIVSKEKERALMLEDKIMRLNEKFANDQQHLLCLQEKVHCLESKLTKALKERELYEHTIKEAAQQNFVLDKNLQKRSQLINQKDSEMKSMTNIIKDLEKELASVNAKLQMKEEMSGQASAAQSDLQKQMKNLFIENKKLKQDITHLQEQLESRGPLRPLRDRSSGRRSSDREREQARQLKDSQLKIEGLKKEIEELKISKRSYNRGSVENLVQNLFRENKLLRKELEELKAAFQKKGNLTDSSKEEVERNIDELNKDMASEKDSLILELKCQIQGLTKIVNEKDCKLQEYKTKLESLPFNGGFGDASPGFDQKLSGDKLLKQEKERETTLNELEEKNKEVENLKRELKKRTYNLQGLVNTELWDKNREIEKLNKVCERQHLEVLTLQKQLREYQLSMVQEKVTSFVSPISRQSGIFTEDKENLQPVADPIIQLQNLTEEKRVLLRKVEELQARLLNTPERDTESLLVQTLRAEKDQAEKLRKEAVNACMLLTTRLQELADFLDSLLPSLCGKKRKVVQQAVERSRELSRSLSIAAEESTLHCSAWTDLQPSLYVPLLPDISTVDFWSGDECQEEAFSDGEQVARLKSQVETLTEEVKQKDGEIERFQSEKKLNDNFLLKSVFGFDEQFIDNLENNRVLDENQFGVNIADIEASLVDTCSDQNIIDKTHSSVKHSPEVKSANIGKITLSSRKKDPDSSQKSVNDASRSKDKDGCLSEYETWSEPDRDVSYARMGLKEESMNINKTTQFKFDETSETAESAPKSPSSRRGSEMQRLQRKIHSLEQVNEALRSELVILHQLAPPAMTRQDKATSIELSRQNLFCVPSHLLEEIRNQREKLEASLFHNDYIRRQLESTVSSLRRSQSDEHEKASLVKLKEVADQLEQAEKEVCELKSEKELFNEKISQLQAKLQQSSQELLEKHSAFLELDNKTSQRIKELEEKYQQNCQQSEEKRLLMEQKWADLKKEKDLLSQKVAETNQQISKLSAEVESYEQEGKKSKKLQDDLNLQLQQVNRQKENLQSLVSEQEQLLADAERERQELATQLIARDRQVSELQQRLSVGERTSSELEAALRSQLDVATHQCAQFEAKVRDLDNANKMVVQLERMKIELERRVAELEAVNAELETRLAGLHIVKPLYSDCETDGGSASPRALPSSPRSPPPLVLPSSPPRYTTQRSQDLTSDYLSDQDAVLSSPQAQKRSLWFPTSPHSQASASPDLGIESDHGRLSSLETYVSKSTSVSLRNTPVNDLLKLEEENTQLRRNLQKTRHALEETLSQLTAANQHKRQYEAQLSAANQHKAKVERAICRQLHKTHSILKKARVNLEEEGKGDLL